MRILAIGDFHGKYPEKFLKKLRKEKFDVIFSVGDFCGSEKASKLFFKYYYASTEEKINNLPKKVKNEIEKAKKIAIDDGIKVLKKLEKEDVPIYFVHGNWDPVAYEGDIGTLKENLDDKKDIRRFDNSLGKKVKAMDFKMKDFGDFVLVGGASSSYPGKIDKKSLDRFFKIYSEESPKIVKRWIATKKIHYARRKKRHVDSFQKAKKLKKPILFLTHNSPYGTKLDIIRDKKAHKLAKGRHYGAYLERLMIIRFKPDLVICGHLHENFGKDKLGKTLLVNTGAAHKNQAVIIDMNKGKVKQVKFFK